MNTQEIIRNFYDGLNKKDDSWKIHLAEDVTFSGPQMAIDEKGKENFINSFTRFLPSVESVSIKQMITEGNNVCLIASYHFVSPTQAKTVMDVAEIWKVAGETLKSLTIYFDLTAFRNFIAGK